MDANKNSGKSIAIWVPVAIVILIIAGTVMFFTNSVQGKEITVDEAIKIALKDAGVSEGEATFLNTGSEYDGGRKIYDIEFYTPGMEYDYEIDSKTGKILVKDADIEKFALNEVNNVDFDELKTNDEKNILISLEASKKLALKDADLNEADVIFVKETLDTDDGRKIYDIEFYKGNIEYDYEIDALTGKILERDTDIENFDIPQNINNAETTTSIQRISEEKAKRVALSHAGIESSKVLSIKVLSDNDDGRSVYDVEFNTSEMEYDYEIDAYNGSVLSVDVDKI